MGVMFLVGAIPHIFGINGNPALVLFISDQIIDEFKIPNSIMYERSVLILPTRFFFGKVLT